MCSRGVEQVMGAVLLAFRFNVSANNVEITLTICIHIMASNG